MRKNINTPKKKTDLHKDSKISSICINEEIRKLLAVQADTKLDHSEKRSVFYSLFKTYTVFYLYLHALKWLISEYMVVALQTVQFLREFLTWETNVD